MIHVCAPFQRMKQMSKQLLERPMFGRSSAKPVANSDLRRSMSLKTERDAESLKRKTGCSEIHLKKSLISCRIHNESP